MQGMASNVPVTPQMADLGASILQAVLMVMTNPDGAASAVATMAKAHKLSDDEMLKYNAMRRFMDEATDTQLHMREVKEDLDKREKELQKAQEKLAGERATHVDAASALAGEQNRHGARVSEIERREARALADERANRDEKERLKKEAERLSRLTTLLEQQQAAIKNVAGILTTPAA